MNNKLTLSEIAALLAERSGKDKKATEQFLREFIQVVSTRLFTDKLVKIKGIGTFKIIPVEERESVHVNTGERFVIPAHYKYSFLADKELRDTVNAPFAFFETTEIGGDANFADLEESEDAAELGKDEEPVEEDVVEEELVPETTVTVMKTDMPEQPGGEEEASVDSPFPEITGEEHVQADIPEIIQDESEPEERANTEITGLDSATEALSATTEVENLAGAGTDKDVSREENTESRESPDKDSEETDEPEEESAELIAESAIQEPAAPEKIVEIPAETLSTPVPEKTDFISASMVPENLTEKKGRLASESSPVEVAQEAGRYTTEKKKSKTGIVFSLFLLFLLLGGLCLFFYKEWKADLQMSAVSTLPVATQPVQKADSLTAENELTGIVPDSAPCADSLEKPVPAVATPGNTPQAQKPVVAKPKAKYIDQVKIRKGDRLTLIALKYYGHKFFWVYLYEANKDVIKNPDNVPVGTTIKIPAPEIYGIDAKNKASVSKAAAMQSRLSTRKN